MCITAAPTLQPTSQPSSGLSPDGIAGIVISSIVLYIIIIHLVGGIVVGARV